MMRVVLCFTVPVYKGYKKCWFSINSNKTVTIKNLVDDICSKFCLSGDVELLLNGIIVPEFEQISIIQSDTDVIDIMNVTPKFSNSSTEVDVSKGKVIEESSEDSSTSSDDECADDEMDTNPIQEVKTSPIKPNLTPRQVKVKQAIPSSNAPNSNKPTPSLNASNSNKPTPSLNASNSNNPTPSSNPRNSNQIIPSSNPPNSDQPVPSQNPYLQKNEVKICNNFKKKPVYLKTTPTHKDRYTNRSKIYKTPEKMDVDKETLNLSRVLKSAVKDTINDTSTKRKHSDIEDKHCKKQNILQNATEKGKIFQTRVSALLNPTVKSSSSKHSDTPAFTKAEPSKIPRDSSSDESGDDVSKPLVPIKNAVVSKPQSDSAKILRDSSSDESGDDVSKPIVPIKNAVVSKPQSDSAKIRRDSSSEDEVVTSLVVPVTKVVSSESSSSEEEEEEKVQSPKKKLQTASSSSESDSEVDVVTNPATKTKSESSSDDSSSENENVKKDGIIIHESRLEPHCKKRKTDKEYSLLPTLQGAPRVSDKIAFKMLGLSSAYTPEISSYKEGVVTNYDLSSQSVTVKLSSEFVEISAGGKFELEEGKTVEDILTMNLRQFIEPKLIPSNET